MALTGDSALQALFEGSGTAELVADGVRVSATALHHGANDWSRSLRRAGIARGDRVIAALPNGTALAQLVVAALAEGITLALVPPGEECVPLLHQLDARLAIATTSAHPNVAVPSPTGGPPPTPLVPQRATQRTDTLAFLLRTSGTGGAPRWIGLSDAGVLAVLGSHLPLLGIDGASVMAALPWYHAFGLVLDLLPALLRARRIITFASRVRDANVIVSAARMHGVTHLSTVPLTVMRLAACDDGAALLRALHGGIVGGAPIDPSLVPVLTATRLRVGYGQTEASPGIMLGAPGEFRAFILGRPVGCEVRIDDDTVLAFRGPNACAGIWHDRAFHPLDDMRWERTDDCVALEDGVYLFRGRASLTFKLANGSRVEAPQLEHAIRLQLPQVTDLMVTTTDGTSIAVVYSTRDGIAVDESMLRALTGRLRSWIGDIRLVPAASWTRTNKGDIDRRHIPR